MVTKLMELYQKYKEIILYVFFGGLATVVSIGSFAWCDVIMHMDPLIANLISWVLAVTFAYITNSLWVFDAKPHGIRELFRQAAGFFGGRVLTLVIEEAILLIFINGLGLPSVAVKVGAQVVVLDSNYIIRKRFVFRVKK